MAATISARGRTEQFLCRAGVYPHARNGYQRLFNRDQYALRVHDRTFFRQFVAPGDLVFDVGANEGRMTQTFTELGASVVAIEANPLLANKVSTRYGSGSVTVESIAVGREHGLAELRLGAYNGHSTLSADWQDRVDNGRWAGSLQVRVTTLDALIDRHGTPDFLKIDVEGFEAEVIAGLSRPVAALAFEFLSGALDVSRACVTGVNALASYEFNLSAGEGHRLALSQWTNAAGIIDELEALARTDRGGYGDVFARLRPT